MRASLKWLEEFVAIDVPADKLAEFLSMSGTKVEAIHKPGAAIGGVVVAEVLDVADHPNADNLTLVDVTTGDVTSRVVCGVRNFAAGDRVPLAAVGARLPEMTVGERRIRGEMSQGMLCSAAELGVSKDHSGILVLPPDAPLGEDVVRVLGLDDTIFEFEITTDRPDCMAMIGLAREIAALLGNELKLPDATVDVADEVKSRVRVEIADRAGCPRYLARYVEDVNVAPSPMWMSSRLLASGIRPISNVVDATNYVLLETGHPLHAFDAEKVADQKIVVRRAKRDERLLTLEGTERRMHPDDLLIADPRRALAIAGVMGGGDSEVSEETTAIILESAYFAPESVAFTARRHVVRTEASARFERGADPEAVPYAAARAAQLVHEIAGGRVAADAVDVYPVPFERSVVTLRPKRTTALLGFEVTTEQQAAHLRSVQLATTEKEGALEVEIPGFRPDIRREVDLIEEVARLAGFDRLPSTLPPGEAGGLEQDQIVDRSLRRTLVGLGLREAWTTTFMSTRDLDALGLPVEHPARRVLRLTNAMSEDEDVLRTTLIPGLLRSVARNLAHRAPGVALFELARVYEPSDGPLAEESRVLAAVFCGARRPPHWGGGDRAWDFFGAKGIFEALCSSVRLAEPTFAPGRGMPFHPTRAATVSIGSAVAGAIGEIHPQVCRGFDVDEGTVAFEIALGPLMQALPGRARTEELPRFPAVYMDLAVVVDHDVPAAVVERTIRGAGAPELTSLRLFDVYTGEQIPEAKKSLAYAIELRVPERTMTDDDAVRVRDRIVGALAERTGASLRS